MPKWKDILVFTKGASVLNPGTGEEDGFVEFPFGAQNCQPALNVSSGALSLSK